MDKKKNVHEEYSSWVNEENPRIRVPLLASVARRGPTAV
jgi:hypothetical protein